MKKYLLGITAIILAAGMCAFTKDNQKIKKLDGDVYWFAVDQHDIASGSVSQSDVSFIVKNTGGVPSVTCSGTPTNYCLVSFTNTAKVVEVPLGSGNYEVSGSQMPDNIQSKRQ